MLVRFIETHIWCSPAASMGKVFSKGTMTSANPSVWKKTALPLVPWRTPWCWTIQFLPICLCDFPAVAPALKLIGSESKKVCVWAFKKELPGAPGIFCFPQPQFWWFLQPQIMGTSLPGLDPWARGLGMGLLSLAPQEGTLQPRYASQFLSATDECVTSPFCTSALPTSLDVASTLIP